MDEASQNDSDELFEFETTDADGEIIILQIQKDAIHAIVEEVKNKLKGS